MTGCQSRMGKFYMPNLVLTLPLVVQLLITVKEIGCFINNNEERFNMNVIGSYVACSYEFSLRRSKCLIPDLNVINCETKKINSMWQLY